MSTPVNGSTSTAELSIQRTGNNFSVAPQSDSAPVQGWRRFWRASKPTTDVRTSSTDSTDGAGDYKVKPAKWSMGVLNDKETDEVPGKVVVNYFIGRKTSVQ